MGQAFSWVKTANPDPDLEENSNNANINQHSSIIYDIEFGINAPVELGQDPEHRKHWYANFFETAYVAPHRDGKSVVVFIPEHERDLYYEDEAQAIVRITEVYERLCLNRTGHPRIVNNVPAFCLERLTPGPLVKLTLPPLTLPVVTPSAKDKLILALYYRWALQALSALHYIHTRSVYPTDFGRNSIWVRADMSIAVAGFTSAAIPTPVPEYDEHGETGNYEYVLETSKTPWRSESLELHAPQHGYNEYSAAYDLFDWATFMWRLMTNDYSTRPLPGPRRYDTSPLFPMDQADWPDFSNDTCPRKYEEKRRAEGAWQVLEEQRLGYILVKAWNGQYENAKEALDDVKKAAEKMGLLVIGEDEIEPENDLRWEEVFEVVRTGDGEYDQELRLVANAQEKITV
ncbi:hypothetical protein GX51_01485 [Blastomyces parvus]|uniref:Protein kinase domain-containing protein n=1 Tax=Blastomyces parvus TaxID=2060905 RepID=A0A2B7X8P8_9EURO|nr:hypothetical protein GX51_01485 [Blastomyces parvus]